LVLAAAIESRGRYGISTTSCLSVLPCRTATHSSCRDPWKLDRLGRSLSHLLATVNELKDRGIAFRSLTEQMDTTTPQGEFLFHVFGALAQFERSLTQERVRAGLAAARRRGRRGGRPVAIDAEKMAAVVAALEGGTTKAAVCRTFGIKRSTLIDSLARIGWSAGAKLQGSMSNAPTAIDRDPDRRAV
jgi:DNA invertase Pin-like site-specific DNA recombinase